MPDQVSSFRLQFTLPTRLLEFIRLYAMITLLMFFLPDRQLVGIGGTTEWSVDSRASPRTRSIIPYHRSGFLSGLEVGRRTNFYSAFRFRSRCTCTSMISLSVPFMCHDDLCTLDKQIAFLGHACYALPFICQSINIRLSSNT